MQNNRLDSSHGEDVGYLRVFVDVLRGLTLVLGAGGLLDIISTEPVRRLNRLDAGWTFVDDMLRDDTC
eukprot:78779-Amorphochlora_amoeboformis.AAC.2